MYRDVLKSAFSKCKVVDIERLIQEWGYFSAQDLRKVDFSRPKNYVFREILSICDEKILKEITTEKVGDLDLMTIKKYPTKRRWTIYHLENKKLGMQDISDPLRLKKKLKQQVNLYFNKETCVSVSLGDGAVWIRLYLQSKLNSRFMNSDTVYLIFYPRTQCFAISAFKLSVKDLLFKILETTFGYKTINNMFLVGLHYKSLFQLAFNKLGETSFGKLKDIHTLPFIKHQPRKRKASEMDREANMKCEDDAMKRQRLESMEKSFGVEEQPTLEKLEYKVELKFKGTKTLPSLTDDKELFKCRIKFEGPAVLEGIRNLVDCGLCNEPLPKHLLRVNSLGKNYILLRDKENQR